MISIYWIKDGESRWKFGQPFVRMTRILSSDIKRRIRNIGLSYNLILLYPGIQGVAEMPDFEIRIINRVQVGP